MRRHLPRVAAHSHIQESLIQPRILFYRLVARLNLKSLLCAMVWTMFVDVVVNRPQREATKMLRDTIIYKPIFSSFDEIQPFNFT